MRSRALHGGHAQAHDDSRRRRVTARRHGRCSHQPGPAPSVCAISSTRSSNERKCPVIARRRSGRTSHASGSIGASELSSGARRWDSGHEKSSTMHSDTCLLLPIVPSHRGFVISPNGSPATPTTWSGTTSGSASTMAGPMSFAAWTRYASVWGGHGAVYPSSAMAYCPVPWYILDEERGWAFCEWRNRMRDLGTGEVFEEPYYSKLIYGGRYATAVHRHGVGAAARAERAGEWSAMVAWGARQCLQELCRDYPERLPERASQKIGFSVIRMTWSTENSDPDSTSAGKRKCADVPRLPHGSRVRPKPIRIDTCSLSRSAGT